MSEQFVADLVNDDPVNDEFVLYLVEDGPWDPSELGLRLCTIQDRLYNAFDAAIDGHVAKRFPDSRGRNIRIQLDCHDEPPPQVEVLVSRFSEHLRNSSDYQEDIKNSEFVNHVRIVTRSQMGRP